MKKYFINRFILLVFLGIFITINSCEKFSDPGLDQETYKPDSTNIYANNKRHVLFVSIDGLSGDAVKTAAPTNIMSLLANSKYSWDVKPLVVTSNETKDITSSGTLTVRLENGSGANATEGSRKVVDSLFNNMHSSGPINAILPNLWFRLQFQNKPVVIGKYTITSGTGTVTVRDPKSWTFEASDDGTNWTVLDRQSGQVFSARSQTKEYRFNNWKPYQYYRLVVSEIFDINSTGYFHLGEWRILENKFLSGINISSWGSLMTGNTRTVHRIGDSSFYASPVDTTNSVPVSPNLTVLRLLHDYDYNIKSVAISSWGNLVTTLLKDADTKFVTGSDEETKNKAVDVLKKDSSKVYITQFGDVFNARLQYGSSNTSPQFLAAVQKTDGYIKELTDAIKSRPSYNNEEWLVIVTSTQGGTGMSDPIDLTGGFIIAYNPLFKQQELSKMNPVINALQEDATRQILYWMKVPNTPAVQTGQLWIDRFGSEFIK